MTGPTALARGVAHEDSVFRDVPGDHRTGSDQSVSSYLYPTNDGRVRADGCADAYSGFTKF